MAPPSAFLPDLRSPRSPKRFFNFSKDPLPPLPPPAPTAAYSPPPVKVTHTANSSFSSNNSSPLGQGAQIVRRPSDARRAMRQPFTAGLPTSTSSRGDFRESPPASAPMLRPRPSQPSMPSPPHEVKPMRPQVSISHLDRRSTLKLKPSISSTSSSISPSSDTPEWEWGIRSRRSTVRPPPRPSPPSPFNAILLSHSSRPSPTASSHVLINLSFGYSLDDPPSNNTITIPWERICRAGGHLARFVERHLGDEAEEEGKPDMTDGESADDSDLDSDYGLGELLR